MSVSGDAVRKRSVSPPAPNRLLIPLLLLLHPPHGHWHRMRKATTRSLRRPKLADLPRAHRALLNRETRVAAPTGRYQAALALTASHQRVLTTTATTNRRQEALLRTTGRCPRRLCLRRSRRRRRHTSLAVMTSRNTLLTTDSEVLFLQTTSPSLPKGPKKQRPAPKLLVSAAVTPTTTKTPTPPTTTKAEAVLSDHVIRPQQRPPLT